MIGKFKLLLNMLAMLGCLLAASQLHAHETGLHDVDHACISCDVEDIAAHGAAPTAFFLFQQQLLTTEVFVCLSSLPVQVTAFGTIRAPPYFSRFQVNI